jgi:hypothetical protein
MSSEPAAKGTSAPVEGGAITAAPVPAGIALEVAAVAEVPSTPPSGAGEGVAVGVPLADGAGEIGATGAGETPSVLVVVEPLVVVDLVRLVDVVVECAVRVDVAVVVEVGTGLVVAAATDSAVEVPESIAPAGP